MSTSNRLQSEEELSQLLTTLVRKELALHPGVAEESNSLDGKLLALMRQLAEQVNPSSAGVNKRKTDGAKQDAEQLMQSVLHDLSLPSDLSASHVAATVDGDLTQEDMELDELIRAVLNDIQGAM
ncbi:hypothetical protein [Alicyclobacillus fodiniaquatilis]|uniref:Uncharacterized protein n=1 Tax=Alicyclobacillus fodiniaquatilis TaxID=1661150 RepID=A0ABW4JH39_9BACL